VIVVYGFGLDVDSSSSLAAFGLALNPIDMPPEQELEVMESATIEQLYAIDYSSGRRRLTQAEYQRWRKLVAAIKAGQMQAAKRRQKYDTLELKFNLNVNPIGIPRAA
jgi:hypothetical protein